ncbi:hypothetical protein AAEU32_14700 [Pseudoalteromonas sp. SSDWG2]|uniref:hypothetical protein n=1 Tax=Pseudoalteromonas sp. SSDWG2 TaxID=3139391 RepID=UPI003BAA8457
MINRDLVFCAITCTALLIMTAIGHMIGYHSYAFAMIAAGLSTVSFTQVVKNKLALRAEHKATMTINYSVGDK